MGHFQYQNFPACSVTSPVSHWTDCRLIVWNEEPCAVSTAASSCCSPSLAVRSTQLVHPSSLTGTLRRVKGDAGEDRGRELCQSEAGADVLNASPLPGYRGDLSQRRTPTSFLRPPGSWKSGRGNPKQAPSTTGLEQAS